MGIDRIRHDLKRIAGMVKVLMDELDTLEHDCSLFTKKQSEGDTGYVENSVVDPRD